MEVLVESSNRKTKKFLESLLPSMIDQLGLKSRRKALLVKIDNDITSMGLTIPIDAVDMYLIVIRPQSLKEMGLTLAHEMVHVRQMAKGTLKVLGNGANRWAGKVYGNQTAYLDMPWELDAFARQEIILRRAIEI